MRSLAGGTAARRLPAPSGASHHPRCSAAQLAGAPLSKWPYNDTLGPCLSFDRPAPRCCRVPEHVERAARSLLLAGSAAAPANRGVRETGQGTSRIRSALPRPVVPAFMPHPPLLGPLTSPRTPPPPRLPPAACLCSQYPFYVDVRTLNAPDAMSRSMQYTWPLLANQQYLPHRCGGVLVKPPAGGACTPCFSPQPPAISASVSSCGAASLLPLSSAPLPPATGPCRLPCSSLPLQRSTSSCSPPQGVGLAVAAAAWCSSGVAAAAWRARAAQPGWLPRRCRPQQPVIAPVAVLHQAAVKLAALQWSLVVRRSSQPGGCTLTCRRRLALLLSPLQLRRRDRQPSCDHRRKEAELPRKPAEWCLLEGGWLPRWR